MGGHLGNALQNCAQSKEIPPVYHGNSVLAGQEYCLWNRFLKNDPTEVFSRYIGAAALRQQCANIPYGIIGGSRCSCRYFDMAMRHKVRVGADGKREATIFEDFINHGRMLIEIKACFHKNTFYF